MEFALAVTAYDEAPTVCSEQDAPKGVIPRALLRPQGVGELTLQEVSMWCGRVLSEVQNQGRHGALMIPLVFGIVEQINPHLKTNAQTHAVGRFVCAMIDAMCVNKLLGTRYLSHAQKVRM